MALVRFVVPALENVVLEKTVLNDAKIRAAKPRDKAYKLTDSHRLYLLVKPGGSKLWKWSYVYDRKQKTMHLGIYPMVSLLDARAKRDDARAQLGDGRDPAVVKRLRVEENIKAARNTFEIVAREWHEMTKTQWAKIHADDVLRSLDRDVFPAIGKLPIAELKPPLIMKVLSAIEDRGAIETAKRVRQRVSAVFVYAIAKGMADADPAEKLGAALKPLRKGRQPAIVDLDRLRKMINDAENDYARPVTRLALRLLALTSVRPSELRGARWDEFEELDGRAPLWRIPAARMKGDLDRKEEIGGDHLVPLAPQSVAILRAVWPLTGNTAYVFPNERHSHRPMSENAIGYLLNRAGYHGRHVPHGFRAAFSTIMNEWAERKGKEHDRKVIDLMLGHVPAAKVEGAYNRAAYLPRRRELARIWADLLIVSMSPLTELSARPSREIGAAHRGSGRPVNGPTFRFPA
jgi:integrase